jgi:excisionase family DNA binding protein
VDRDAACQTILLKPAEVAARLAVSRTWLYDAAKTGRIPSIRIGGDDGPLRFVPEDIDRWLREARSAWLPGRGPVATEGPGELSDRLRVASCTPCVPP